jgi:hypothetical protein
MSDLDCGDPDCSICHPYVTKTGRVLTEDDIQALADEAEQVVEIPDRITTSVPPARKKHE